MDTAKTAAGRTTRDQIVAATCDLMEAQGFHATGLSEIIRASGAPRGSLYYYFPDGKEGLAAEAIARTGAALAARIAGGLAEAPALGPGLAYLADQIAGAVERSGFRAGGPLTSVAMETATTSERLNLACRDAFTRLKGAFTCRLAADGYPPARAEELAEFITASIEGGIILARTYHSGDPLRRVGAELARLIATSPPSRV
jgi:TetR/AcrR family transcriptional repressor of lmrAB and yxaGH operons